MFMMGYIRSSTHSCLQIPCKTFVEDGFAFFFTNKIPLLMSNEWHQNDESKSEIAAYETKTDFTVSIT